MDSEELKSRIITMGKASVLATETVEYVIRGGLRGFDLCQALHTPEDFTRVLAERTQAENHLFDQVHEGKVPVESYHEYRVATLQIDFVYQRLCVLWNIPPLSASALMQVMEIMAEWRKALCN